MIIFGTGSRTISTFQDGDQKFTLTGRYFHLFWMAVFPIGKKLYSEGPEGTFEYDLDNPQVMQLMENHQAKSGYGAMFFLFWIVAMCLGLLYGGYKLLNKPKTYDYSEYETLNEEVVTSEADPEMDEIDKKNFVLINDAQPGDYWIMKFPAEDPPFIVYRIDEVNGSSIVTTSANFGYDEGTGASAAIREQVWNEKENYWNEEKDYVYEKDELKSLYYTSDDEADPVKGILFYPFRLE